MARKRQRRNRRKQRKSRKIGIFVTIFLLVTAYLYLRYVNSPTQSARPITEAGILARTERHYGEEVGKYAAEFNLPSAYFKALIVLECSGRKHFEPRFEPRVYEQLKAVRDGRLKHYNHIRRRQIKNASDAALKNLATSWGPFQLMGYQCMNMGINVQDIRGEKAVYWGIKWIQKRYGRRLRRGHYRDCFHIHNTGRPFPATGHSLTHDPEYVNKGLKYLEYFQGKEG